MPSRKSRQSSQASQSRKASLFQARQSTQARQSRQSRQTRRASPVIQETPIQKQPIERTPPYMYNKMLEYSGIHYPGYIRNANHMVVLNDRRLPATWIQDNYAFHPIDLNFQNPNQEPLPLDELRRRIEENEFHRKQLVNMPLNEHQLDEFDYKWNAYLFWNPSKRPPNYQVPDEDTISSYDYNYRGPREITYEYQDPRLQTSQENNLRQNQNQQHNADLFWNPSKRPANYRMPSEYVILDYDKIHTGPREIVYEYQDPILKRQHAEFLRRKRYLSTI